MTRSWPPLRRPERSGRAARGLDGESWSPALAERYRGQVIRERQDRAIAPHPTGTDRQRSSEQAARGREYRECRSPRSMKRPSKTADPRRPSRNGSTRTRRKCSTVSKGVSTSRPNAPTPRPGRPRPARVPKFWTFGTRRVTQLFTPSHWLESGSLRKLDRANCEARSQTAIDRLFLLS